MEVLYYFVPSPFLGLGKFDETVCMLLRTRIEGTFCFTGVSEISCSFDEHEQGFKIVSLACIYKVDIMMFLYLQLGVGLFGETGCTRFRTGMNSASTFTVFYIMSISK